MERRAGLRRMRLKRYNRNKKTLLGNEQGFYIKAMKTAQIILYRRQADLVILSTHPIDR